MSGISLVKPFYLILIPSLGPHLQVAIHGSSPVHRGDIKVSFRTAVGTTYCIYALALFSAKLNKFFLLLYGLTHSPAFVFIFLLHCSRGREKKFSIQNSFVKYSFCKLGLFHYASILKCYSCRITFHVLFRKVREQLKKHFYLNCRCSNS